MLKPDVIIVGASVRSLAESAIRDSLVPVCVDFFADADLRRALLAVSDSPFADPLLIESYSEVSQRLAVIDQSVPVLLVGGAENGVELVRQLERQRPVLGLSSEQISALRDPSLVFPELQAAGCDVPSFVCGPDFGDAMIDEGKNWLLKHRESSGGQLVSHWDANSPLQRGEFLQQHMDGVCFSGTFFACEKAWPQTHAAANGQRDVSLEGVALQLSGLAALNCGGFQYCGNVGPLCVSETMQAQLLLAAQTLTNRWNLTGFFGIDFVLSKGRAFAIEINPRLTASHELHESPGDKGHVFRQLAVFATASNSPLRALSPRREPIARLVVYASDDVQISEELAAGMQNSTRRHQPSVDTWLADVPVSGTCTKTGTPLCSLYVTPDKAINSTALQSILRLIPADTSKIQTELVQEIQGQIEVVQNV